MCGNKNNPSCIQCDIKKHSVFKHLKLTELEKVSELKECYFTPKGEAIFREGYYPAGLYIIHSGKVKLEKLGIEGKPQILRFGKPGDILGYQALFSGEPSTVSAIAMEPTVTCCIPQNIFFDLFQNCPGLASQIMQVLSKDLKYLENLLTEIIQKPAKERLAEVLLQLSDTFGYANDEITLNISLSRTELANMIGTAPETTIRFLSDFKKSNIIQLKGHKISITDRKALMKTAHLSEQF